MKTCSECQDELKDKSVCDGCKKPLKRKVICGGVANGEHYQSGHFCSLKCFYSEYLYWFETELS